MAKPKIQAFKTKHYAYKRYKREQKLWKGIYAERRDKYYAPTIEKIKQFWIVSWWEF